MTWPVSAIRTVLQLKDQGLTDRAVNERTGVPIATIRAWRRRGLPRRAKPQSPSCETCGGAPHRWESDLPAGRYAYLLGIYLGDGHLGRWGDSWRLRIALDVGYPAIIEEVCGAITEIRGRAPRTAPDPAGRQSARIDSSWRSWPCLFPQHGPGRKHARPIELVDWQRQIVADAPGPFLRGLIQTDGWRGVNRVHVKGRDYEYPRYQFSNRSDDIRRLFTDACDVLGVQWRPWTRYHISVAQRDSVALLDRHVGPKS